MGARKAVLLGASTFFAWYFVWSVLDYYSAVPRLLEWLGGFNPLKIPACFPSLVRGTCTPLPGWFVFIYALPFGLLWLAISAKYFIEYLSELESRKSMNALDEYLKNKERIKEVVREIFDERDLDEFRRKRGETT